MRLHADFDPLQRPLTTPATTPQTANGETRGARNRATPRNAYPLYDPAFEHDNCGTGFVADVAGSPSHLVVTRALEALANLAHRGAMDADTETSDGAGLLTQVPTRLLHDWLAASGHAAPAPGKLALGMVFLPRNLASAKQCRASINSALERRGIAILGWREVPQDATALGSSAQRTRPRIEQVLARVPDEMTPEEAERQLYLTRRDAEHRVLARGITGLYIASCSARTVVYKGLVSAANLPMFYQDLQQPTYESALAIFHQRYSTNTFPSWPLAQPMRLLAHNGEINTVRSNRRWMRAHEAELEAVWHADAEVLRPVIESGGSDSTSLDNALELLTRSGRDLPDALALLVPEAWEGNKDLPPAVRDFFRSRAPLMGPWDGPAALIFSDGRYVGAMLDRNGLRPMRFVLTNDGTVVVASEVGVIDLPVASIVEKGRLGPGQMLAVDTAAGVLWHNVELKARLAAQHPYSAWTARQMITIATDGEPDTSESRAIAHVDTITDDLLARQALFGHGHEDVELVLRPMATDGAEAIWSMGDDTPLAVLAQQRRPLSAYFRQRFAQVTNPPIDPLRERLVMSLTTYLGARGSCLVDVAPSNTLIDLSSPVLDGAHLRAILAAAAASGIAAVRLSTTYSVQASQGDESEMAPDQGMRAALAALERDTVAAVNGGAGIVILSDIDCRKGDAPLPQPLAIAAAHEALLAAGLRQRAGLVVETGAAWDVHSVALLLGYGANAVHPHLALRSVRSLAGTRGAESVTPDQAAESYRHALEKGLAKVLSRMGLSTLESYIGGQQFECIGVDEDLVARYFPGTPTSLGGLSLAALDAQARGNVAASVALATASRESAAAAITPDSPTPFRRPRLSDRGLVRYRKDGEYHAANPLVVKSLQRAAETGRPEDYAAYSSLVAERPATAIRDLLTFKRRRPIAKERVEPASAIVARFITSAMSLGSLSPEAHLTLTLGANSVGARSNTGEGGEDPAWRHAERDGVSMNSRVKQVASGRFGVTTDYLVRAEELEIKMAQGSKPGEGGQIPSRKVTDLIARLRHTSPGTSLISPPPHHDIYSIEDLAQLIFDLREVNPRAAIGVKLVAERGVGTIAAGVAKAHADYVLISGHDGGTGASPLSSIKNVGSPWEIGLAEAQQVLRLNRLRSRVRVRVDGGFKTGRDVMIAALLGADEFGFGTAALIALGCDMARQCHLDTCPTGIATQREDLRRRFTGSPEHVAHFLLAVAEEVREILAQLGASTLDAVIGRADLLMVDESRLATVAASGLTRAHLEPLLAPGERNAPRKAGREARRYQPARPMDAESHALAAAEIALARGDSVRAKRAITNRVRAEGARLAGAIAERWGDAGLPTGNITRHYVGSAGQSFGAFALPGMRLLLTGDANDYVAKGMTGGEIAIRPPAQAPYAATDQVILGNTALYGATGGLLLASGRAGERFAVRNSGAVAVIEGVGDHACEYMTAGVVLVLGPVGRNFAAGMSGGIAYVLDDRASLSRHLNDETVVLERCDDAEEQRALAALISRHRLATGSTRAAELLTEWDHTLRHLWRVRPTTLSTVAAAVHSIDACLRTPARPEPQPTLRDEALGIVASLA